MGTRATKFPPDFVISDALRAWSTRRSWPMYLPDVFLPDLREWATSPNCRRPTAKDWGARLKTWIRSASPAGDKYSAAAWERRIAQAKEIETRQYERQSEQRQGGEPVPMPAATRALLERIRRAQ